jgi:nucleotide-binding universal stress UspA family protein
MKQIVVPTDFTEVAVSAVRYASELALSSGSVLNILHIVESQNDVVKAELELELFAKKYAIVQSEKVKCTVRVGNIFDDIAKVAEDEIADLVVMGTHGLRGMQFIVGSHALRIITESEVPVLIVQAGTTKTGKPSSILLPLDLHRDTKQKLKIASDYATYFGSTIHIILPTEKDEYLNNTIRRNMAYAENFLEEKGVKYVTAFTKESSSGFVDGLLKYAQSESIDLICILNNSDERLLHAFGKDSEQKIITNDAAIPVLIFNPAAALVDAASIFAQ